MNRLFLFLFGAVTFVAHAQVPDYVPTEGLVGWYPLDGNAQDLSTLSNEGSIHGATPTMDRHGNENGAMNFDVDDWDWGNGGNWVYIPFHEAFNTSEVTVSAWVQRTSDGAATSPQSLGIAHRFQYGYNSPNGEAWRFHILHGDNGSHLYSQIIEQSPSPASYLGLTTDTALAEGTWSHVVMTWDDETLKVFLNGQLVGSVNDAETAMNTIGNSGVSLGMSVQANGHWGPLDGNLDEFGMWNRALSDEEVFILSNAEPPVPGCTDPTACNFDDEATSDDGNCIPSGCMEPLACNYNTLAECEGEACDYTCCPGPGCCADGTSWDAGSQSCVPWSSCPTDLDGDAITGVSDLMVLLSSFGTACEVDEEDETGNWTCGSSIGLAGKMYPTVQICGQCWFAENLSTTTYRNGDSIPENLADEDWEATTAGATAVYDNNPAMLPVYGRLYNGWAVHDERGICPSGWHVANNEDWEALELTLGMVPTELTTTGWRGTTQGHLLKASEQSEHPWTGCNLSGFSGLGGGTRYDQGNYSELTANGYFWSLSAESSNGIARAVNVNLEGVWRSSVSLNRGLSIRCLKDQ